MNLTICDDCPVDARLTHMNAQSERAIAENIDGVIAIGGGSVMCAAKGVALAASNGGDLGTLSGKFVFDKDPLPMIMVPTTAGSGSEVSQWTVYKNDILNRKTSVGGAQNFPEVAILDPVTLSTLPNRLATLSAVDALTHAIEAYFTSNTSPVSDALALDAARRLFLCMRSSIIDKEPAAQLENLIASTMANMACTNAGLGLCHSMSSPMESDFEVAHPVVVGALLLRVLPFNAQEAPERTRTLATTIGLSAEGNIDDVASRIVTALTELYQDLGQPLLIPEDKIDRSNFEDIAKRAVTAIARGRTVNGPIDLDTIILTPNIRDTSVANAMQIYKKSVG